jgi:hypothetical protein
MNDLSTSLIDLFFSFILNYIYFFLLWVGSGRRSRVNNEEPRHQGKPTSMVNNNNNNNNGNGKAKSIEK